MNYTRKDVAIGFAIILIVILGAYLYRRSRTPKVLPTPTSVAIEFQKKLEDDFKYDIPDDANTYELKDVTGGDSRGVATDKEVLADVSDPKSGYFYQGWLEKDSNLVSVGKLQLSKGGWLLQFDKTKLPDADRIVISLERYSDNKIETRVLEGSFK
jgi:hypothetical protein